MDIYAHLPPLNFRGRPMTPSNGEYGRKILAAVLSVKVWEDCGLAVWEELHLGFRHGHPLAPKPDGWILALPLLA